MKTVEAIDARIKELKNQLGTVEGQPTEVYTRIVGYYRAVKNWNKGKRSEYGFRTPFALDHDTVNERAQNPVVQRTAKVTPMSVATEEPRGNGSAYAFFYRNTCPNCPPVKDFLDNCGLEGRHINVDDEGGLDMAREHNVMSSPTVIFFDDQGAEAFRSDNAQSLSEYLQPAVAAEM